MFKGYRTIIFNVIMTAVMIYRAFKPEGLEGVDEATINQGLDFLDKVLMLFWGGGNLALRAVTDTKVGQKS